jgi:Fur family ferric uptake transcriptional regulator
MYVTSPRKVLFNILLNSSSPLSVREIESKTKNIVSRASIYRALQTLKKLDIISQVRSSNKYELSDKFSRHHHHMTCEKCGRVITIKLGDKMESAIEGFGRKHGFKINSHEVELRGLCRYCS